MHHFRLRDFRRLPPFLHVVRIAAGLLLFAGSALLLLPALQSFSQSSLDVLQSMKGLLLCTNIGLIGWACASVVTTYRLRFRQPDSGPFSLSSWQGQVRMLALLAALPASALVLALIVPLTSPAFFLVWGITPLALFVLRLADLLAARRATNNSALRTPRAP